MVSVEEVRNVLAQVNDPELHRSLTDLKMVRDVGIHDGKVEVTIALTVPNCPLKGKIESDLMKLVFKKVYCFRPGLLKPTRGLKNAHKFYYIFTPLYPIFRIILPNFVLTLQELGIAMINSVTKGYEKQILEVRDIVKLSKL